MSDDAATFSRVEAPLAACGSVGTFYTVMIADEFGEVSWLGTFEDFDDAVGEGDDYARTHKAMVWISPAICKFDARPDDESEGEA